MIERGFHTRQEILSQPGVWKDILEQMKMQAGDIRGLFQPGAFHNIILTGCGSTYYLSLAAASAMQNLCRIPSRGMPASEIWLYSNMEYLRSETTLLVAVSRSGETTETIRACQAFRSRKGRKILTLSCYPGSELSRLGDVNMVFPAAQEKSVAQTRAFSSLYLALIGIAVLASGAESELNELFGLPRLCSQVIESAQKPAQELGRNLELERFFFLGSGFCYGLACELSLKMKEMSLSYSEPFHFMEFRHGPMSMINERSLVFGLLSSNNSHYEIAVLEEMEKRGARTLMIGEETSNLAFNSSMAAPIYNPLYLPAGQLLAYERALAKGLDPDKPHNLTSVVKLA